MKVVYILDEGNNITRQFLVETRFHKAPIVGMLLQKDGMGFTNSSDLQKMNSWPGKVFKVVAVGDGIVTTNVLLEVSDFAQRRRKTGLLTMPLAYYAQMLG